MPSRSTKKSHEENRAVICAVCYSESGLKCARKVSVNVEKAIQKFVCQEYCISDPHFPSGICRDCNFILTDWVTGKADPRPLPVAANYDPQLPRNTRSLMQCTCRICDTARLSGPKWRAFVLSCRKQDKAETSFQKLSQVRLCGNCFSKIYQGSNHSVNNCQSKRVTIDNLEAIVETDTLENIAKRTLTNLVTSSGENSCVIRSAYGGRPATVTLGKPPESVTQPTLSAEDVLVMQNEAPPPTKKNKIMGRGISWIVIADGNV